MVSIYLLGLSEGVFRRLAQGDVFGKNGNAGYLFFVANRIESYLQNQTIELELLYTKGAFRYRPVVVGTKNRRHLS